MPFFVKPVKTCYLVLSDLFIYEIIPINFSITMPDVLITEL